MDLADGSPGRRVRREGLPLGEEASHTDLLPLQWITELGGGDNQWGLCVAGVGLLSPWSRPWDKPPGGKFVCDKIPSEITLE